MWQAIEQGVRAVKLEDGEKLSIHLEFVPPNRRIRDWDNLLASVKSGLDGLADAIKVDDSRWRLSFDVLSEIGGMVRVEIK